MKYTDSHGITVHISPWLDCGYRLKNLVLNLSIGGELTNGSIELEGLIVISETLETLDTCNTGEITIEKEGRSSYIGKFFVTSRAHTVNGNAVLNFVCVPDPKYVRDKIKMTYIGTMEEVLEEIYPNLDIQCESDIQGERTFHQNSIPSAYYLPKLAAGYRKNIVYGYDMDTFFIKEAYTQDELDNAPIIIATLDQDTSGYEKEYNPELYSQPKNDWESEEENQLGEDYSELQARFVRSVQKRGDIFYVYKDFEDLRENATINRTQNNSSYYQTKTIRAKDWPDYELGEVVYFNLAETEQSDTYYPHNYYIVSGIRISFSTKGQFIFETTFAGLEENGLISLDNDYEDDPTSDEEEPTYFRDEEGNQTQLKDAGYTVN